MSAMLLIILWWEAGVKKAARKQNEFKVVVQALLRSTIIKVVRFHCYTEGGYLPRHTCVGGLGESEMRVIPAFIIKSRFGSAWLLFIRRMTVMHVKLFKKSSSWCFGFHQRLDILGRKFHSCTAHHASCSSTWPRRTAGSGLNLKEWWRFEAVAFQSFAFTPPYFGTQLI